MRKQDVIRLLPVAVVVVVMLATHPGWRIIDLTNVLDPSWEGVLNKAWAERWQFGSDIVFTFGPYGFLFTEYIPTFPLRLAITSFMAVLFIASLFRLLSVATSRPLVLALLALVIWDAVKAEYADSWFQLLAILPCLLIWSADPRDEFAASPARPHRFDRVLLHALMPALAVMSLAKLNLAAISIASVGSIVLYSIARRRPSELWPVFTFALSCIGLWLLAGQSIAGIPAWVRGSLEIISGYDSMSRGSGTTTQLIVLVAAMAALTAALWYTFWCRHGFWAVVPTAAIAGFLLVSFKSSIVRFDHVVIIRSVVASLGVLAAVVAMGARTQRCGAKLSVSIGVACLLLTVAASSYSRSESWRAFPGRYFGTYWDPRAQVEPMMTAFREVGKLDERWEQNLAQLRDENPIPPIDETVDVFGHEQALAIAYRWNYRPRPVIQSYSAYTPKLLEINRDFLRGSSAPERILFSLDTIDQRYSSLDDGLSWQELLTRYSGEVIDKDHALLSRRSAPGKLELTALATQELNVGETIKLPEIGGQAAIWVEVRMELSALGKLKKTLYKSNEVKMDVTTGDGKKQTHRFVPGSGRAGFLLSPYVATTEAFVQLNSADSAIWSKEHRVAEVRFYEDVSQNARLICYQPRMTVQLYKLTWERGTR